MDPEKTGEFIKKIRKKYNLTQKELADKYNVTYQAVSKWENKINIPDIVLLRQMSKDFNVDITDILDGEVNNKKKRKTIIISIIAIILVIVVGVLIYKINNNSFSFKTISSTCTDFIVTGSLAYDKSKSSIYISNVEYCGKEDNTVYDQINCQLYENTDNIKKEIDTCLAMNNVDLQTYLKNIKINVDNYEQICKSYTDDNLYLEIIATKNNIDTKRYNIPLKIENNCK